MERHERSPAPIQIAVIVGSTRDGRRGRDVADWYVDQVHGSADVEIELIDLVDHRLPERFTFADDGDVAGFRARLDRADAFVVVTPEYNHSYPASLKLAIDYGKDEWRRKPVAFVSYGGVSGGLRAVEHLRGVFAELHAVGLRDSVSFANAWEQFDEQGRLRYPERAERSMATMLKRLAWWEQALRDARLARDYGAAA